MDGFPVAVFLASEESVFLNQKVLFDLVRPTKTGDGVESSAGLANVIPRKRIYRMETEEELEIFKNELLKRPLVLQPVANYGMGLGKGETACGLYFDTTNYVMFINQTHPKILGRIQMGVDAAKKAMQKEVPFLLRYKFGSIMQREHYDVFTDKYHFDMNFPRDRIAAKFRFANWEHGELIVRYPGPPQESLFKKPTVMNIEFKFEDLTHDEIECRPQLPFCPPRPADNPVSGDEIRSMLPNWTVNEVTPLEEIGETAPTSNYNYAQAGKLYESFRRKKKRKPDQQKPDLHPVTREGFDNVVELNELSPAVSGGLRGASPLPSPRGATADSRSYPASSSVTNMHENGRLNKDYPQDQFRRGNQPQSHLYPDVHINTRRPNQNEQFASLDVTGRDSERSSYSIAASSTGADSGFHGNESDVYSYDRHNYNETRYHSPRSMRQENLGFRHDDDDDDEVLRKHKEFVNKMLHQNNPRTEQPGNRDYYNQHGGHNTNIPNHSGYLSNGNRKPSRNPTPSHQMQSGVAIGAEEMSESFI